MQTHESPLFVITHPPAAMAPSDRLADSTNRIVS
jgi:hypothetical protein